MGDTATMTGSKPKPPLALFQGLLPIDRAKIPIDMIAGVTLAALAIPEVMGYTSIAGMPVITGLYTILLPVLVFALLGSSRHLVVGADSATAAVMAAGLAGLAASQSTQYVALAGLLALMAGALLLLARLAKLGFIADFLSRTVLIGFLTGVGIQVACGQVSGMLGVPSGTGVTIAGHDFDNTFGKLLSTLGNLDQISWATFAVSAGVLVTMLGLKLINRKIPGALLAVVGAIFISWNWDLASHGVATLGPLPSGLPHFGLPDVTWSDIPALMGTAVSIFILVLAQSAATSRAYAAKYNDHFDENTDLVGLAAASVASGLSGTFVVNGSPTKTEILEEQGGKSQVANMTMAVVVLIVTLFLTQFLTPMPKAVLGGIVFLIGYGLIDIKGLKHVKKLAPTEFWIAVITAAVVCCVGVEQGIILALVVSVLLIIERSYRAHRFVVGVDPEGDPSYLAAEPGAQSLPGLIVFRYDAPLFYANANRFTDDVEALIQSAPDPVTWVVLDCDTLTDVDYSAGLALNNLVNYVHAQGAHLVLARPDSQMLVTLEEVEVLPNIGREHIFDSLDDAVAAFRADPSGRPVTAITPVAAKAAEAPPSG